MITLRHQQQDLYFWHWNFSECERLDSICQLSSSHAAYRILCRDTAIFLHKGCLHKWIITFELLSCQIVVLELKIQVVNGLSNRLILLKVQTSKIRVGQCFIYSYPLFRVECEQFLQQINCLWIGKGKEFVEILAVFLEFRYFFDQKFALLRDMLHIVEIWNPQILADELDLVSSISSRKEWSPLQHLCENASHTPHIH